MIARNLLLGAVMSAGMIALPTLAADTPQGKSGEASAMKKASKAEKSVIGEVTDTLDVEVEGASDSHRLVKIRNMDGKEMVVDLGLVGNLEDLELAKGDRLIAVGRNARINERPVLFAKYAGKLYATGRTGVPANATAAR